MITEDSFQQSGWSLVAVALVTFGVGSLICSGIIKTTTNFWNDYEWCIGNTVISFWMIISVILIVIGFILFFFFQDNSFDYRLQNNYTE